MGPQHFIPQAVSPTTNMGAFVRIRKRCPVVRGSPTGTGLARGMQAGCQHPEVYVGTLGCISAGNQKEKALGK